MRTDRVFTVGAARRDGCPVCKLTPLDRSVQIATLVQQAKLIPSQEPKELILPPGLKIASPLDFLLSRRAQ